ncbi:MAG TPA: response regulator [Polyangiaceae bacterium]|nr:response regulator [Polyangiaceae bacterium]
MLLIDDEPAVLETMKALLEPAFEVTICYSAREALQLLTHESFAVICCDWQMPGIDGLEFFRQLARQPKRHASGRILITAHADSLFKKVGWAERKMLGFLRKPCRPADLIERVTHFAHVAAMKQSSQELSAAVLRATR